MPEKLSECNICISIANWLKCAVLYSKGCEDMLIYDTARISLGRKLSFGKLLKLIRVKHLGSCDSGRTF
jgi:hypothetical protein